MYFLFKDKRYTEEAVFYTVTDKVSFDGIFVRNESNMDILLKSIEQGSIKNEEMLKLYKNYDVMSSDIMELWQQFV